MSQPITLVTWSRRSSIGVTPGATTASAAYLSGASGIVKNLVSNNYYYQDGSGSTSHLAGGTGALVEWYRYDLQGTPIIYSPTGNQRVNSKVRHLFTGQQWYSELGLYDLRNRYYSPDIGRFLQPDPIGFDGDPTNLYRYCGNNPVKSVDPVGTIAYLEYGNNPKTGGAVLTAVNIPITYAGGTPALQDMISSAIVNQLSSNPIDVGVNVYQGSGYYPRINTLVISPGNLSIDQTKLGPLNDYATIFVYPGEDSEQIKSDAAEIGALFMGPEIRQMLNIYDAGGGVIYLYDSNWNWVSEIDDNDTAHTNRVVVTAPAIRAGNQPAGSTQFAPSQWPLTGKTPTNPVDSWDPYAGEFSPGGNIPIGVYSGAMGVNWGGSGGGGCHWFNPGPL